MSGKWGARLTVAASSLTLAGIGLMSAGASAAMATPTPGTTGPGSWSFDPGTGINAITTTSSPPTVSYQAQVQQPINAPGQIPSVFSNKTRTIPVKYQVQKCTTPGTSAAHYPDTLESDLGARGGTPGSYGALSFTPPSGTTLSQLGSLIADFSWKQGHDAGGSMRWSVVTNQGTFYIYYGDLSTSFQTGQGGSGINMVASVANGRVETPETGPGTYVNWSDLLNGTNGVAHHSSAAVSEIDLVVDAGFTGTQQVQLQDVSITDNGAASTYTPGDVTSGGGATTCAADTTDPMWISLTKLSGNAPAAPVDESTITDTQGDSGGQFRVTDGMYMYNLPMSQLDPTAQYRVGISPNSDGSSPVGVVQFGIK